jgi:hypothetical protein
VKWWLGAGAGCRQVLAMLTLLLLLLLAVVQLSPVVGSLERLLNALFTGLQDNLQLVPCSAGLEVLLTVSALALVTK